MLGQYTGRGDYRLAFVLIYLRHETVIAMFPNGHVRPVALQIHPPSGPASAFPALSIQDSL